MVLDWWQHTSQHAHNAVNTLWTQFKRGPAQCRVPTTQVLLQARNRDQSGKQVGYLKQQATLANQAGVPGCMPNPATCNGVQNVLGVRKMTHTECSSGALEVVDGQQKMPSEQQVVSSSQGSCRVARLSLPVGGPHAVAVSVCQTVGGRQDEVMQTQQCSASVVAPPCRSQPSCSC